MVVPPGPQLRLETQIGKTLIAGRSHASPPRLQPVTFASRQSGRTPCLDQPARITAGDIVSGAVTVDPDLERRGSVPAGILPGGHFCYPHERLGVILRLRDLSRDPFSFTKVMFRYARGQLH